MPLDVTNETGVTLHYNIRQVSQSEKLCSVSWATCQNNPFKILSNFHLFNGFISTSREAVLPDVTTSILKTRILLANSSILRSVWLANKPVSIIYAIVVHHFLKCYWILFNEPFSFFEETKVQCLALIISLLQL